MGSMQGLSIPSACHLVISCNIISSTSIKIKKMKKFTKLILLSFISSSLFGQSTLVWDFDTDGRVFSSPVVDDSTLYIGSNDSCLYALDKFKGSLKWKFRTGVEMKSRPLLL